MQTYSFLSQREAWARLGDDLVTQLGQLTATAFASFDGVAQPSPAKTRWYLARPGMDRELSGVVLWREQVVSNIYVTRLRFPIEGRMFDVGFIDTVMTHPEHRRQGLARQLLTRAVAGIREAGLDAAALYTHPETVAFQIYTKMGFLPHRRSMVWTREGSVLEGNDHLAGMTATVAACGEEASLRDLVNQYNTHKDGFVTLDDPLWAWRKHERPAHMPATVVAARKGTQMMGTVTFCPAKLITPRGPTHFVYLTDLALAADHEGDSIFAALLRASPPADRWITLAGENDQPLQALLARFGFVPAPGEISLVYPLGDAIAQALKRSGRPWYVLPESTVGV